MSMLWKSAILGVSVLIAAFSSAAANTTLPEGKGRSEVQAQCSACHTTDRIPQSLGYSREGWLELIATMIDLSSDPTRRNVIVDYLAKHFPPSEHWAPTIVEGQTRITFHEWVVPSLGQRSRDPAEAPDGSIWWVGQWGNLAGRIDPHSGDMREYSLPPGTMPHSVTLDKAGGVWLTGNKNASIVKLNPANGGTTVYPMPDPAARDPHTAVFDNDGILWFTLQHANQIGRLDPASGKVRLATLPTPGARPYGIKIDAAGVPWVACNGSNCLIRVNPKTLALKEITLPHKDTTARRLDIAADGMIWYVNSGRGRLGRYNPATGEIREWPSPSGPRSHPYAIALVEGKVWYNESGMRPDSLVRFDPESENFQSWPIPSGGIYSGIVRHMRPTRGGDLLIHQSATNRIIRVEINHQKQDHKDNNK